MGCVSYMIKSGVEISAHLAKHIFVFLNSTFVSGKDKQNYYFRK